ncbi:GDSL esterase/lipase [Quillaja saponaria]|uniref:GDSL esterase/lipase n=1 Tax=Quillaja saponaria TaxID=32244 RepID=A0AAD7P501_QUISA|nr:GDSL esterase/lipase [Quillaja saponaria]KAJ7963342.1 GDSL esterase/lipase [Quillaja saponaria]
MNMYCVDMVIGNLTTVIKEIYKKWGRKFGVRTLGPLGCFPVWKVLVTGGLGGCFEEGTELAKLHNGALFNILRELESQLEGFKYAITDFLPAITDLINMPSKYGFKEGKVACCGSGPYRGILSCGGKRGVTEYEFCDNASEYVFFDSAHFTEKVNQLFSKLMWSGTGKVTGPYNLKALIED